MSWLGRLFGRSSSPPKQLGDGRTDSLVQSPGRMDGWGNVITGLKTARDKRRGAFHDFTALSDLEVRELWLGDDMIRRLIEMIPKEVMREGYELKIGTDEDDDIDGAERAKEMAEDVMAAAEELGFNQQVVEALKMRRAYGGSAIFPVIEGAQGGDLSQPLEKKRITKVNAFHLFEPREMYPVSWYNDLNDPKFGRPAVYRFMPIVAGGVPAKQTMVEVHESRLIIFQGIKVSRLHQAGNRIGWGDNVVTAPYEVVKDFGLTWGGVSALMQDFAQAVLQIDGLANLIATDQDKVARERIAQIDLIRSFMRMIVIDTKDKFAREQTPLSGVPDILREFWVRLAAAFDMPVTLVAGISPAGLNATGESDRAFWFDRVGGEQAITEPQVEQGLELLMSSTEGPTDGQVPDVWSIKWRELYKPTAKETAETRWLVAQAIGLLIDKQVITPEEAAHSLFGGDSYSMEIQLDMAAREAMKNLDPTGMASGGTGIDPATGLPIPGPQPQIGAQTELMQGNAQPPESGGDGVGKRAIAPPPKSSVTGRAISVPPRKQNGVNGAG